MEHEIITTTKEQTLSFSSCSLRVYWGPSWSLLVPFSSSSSSWSVAYIEVSLSLICLPILTPPSWSSSRVSRTPLFSPPSFFFFFLSSSNPIFLKLDVAPIAKDINFKIYNNALQIYKLWTQKRRRNDDRKITGKNLLYRRKKEKRLKRIQNGSKVNLSLDFCRVEEKEARKGQKIFLCRLHLTRDK